MDATARGEQKAPAPPSDGETPTSVPEVRQGPLPEGVAGGSGGAAVESGGEEDEQVERFYALLASIRALRGMYTSGGGASTGSGGSRKRARGAEPPWRPAFRMEDFEDAVDAGCAMKRQERRGAAAVRRPARNEAAADDEEVEEGEVVEGKDRIPASQRAGVLTS